MKQIPKLAIFDIDGTIARKGVVLPEAVEGFKHLHELGCLTTVSTGRGYRRLRDVLGKDFGTIVSEDTPIIVEHGTKIVNQDGSLVFGEFFSETEIEHIVDFIRANIELFKFAWINPNDVTKKGQVWCTEQVYVQPETENRGHFANVFHAPLGEFRALLLAEPLSCVTMRLKDHVKVENLKLKLTKTDTHLIFQDGNMEFVKANINKGLAVLYTAKTVGFATEDILVAGNAINDIEMLDLGVGTSILVSPPDERSAILAYLSSPESIVTVSTPEDLGKYLSSLST
ncbi:HAD family phosphatase [Candidatus Saccharibacteria bacterium]|nr:MAG: HAD family phosphatase [Candidatus Saccharibacteria bacterium]